MIYPEKRIFGATATRIQIKSSEGDPHAQREGVAELLFGWNDLVFQPPPKDVSRLGKQPAALTDAFPSEIDVVVTQD